MYSFSPGVPLILPILSVVACGGESVSSDDCPALCDHTYVVDRPVSQGRISGSIVTDGRHGHLVGKNIVAIDLTITATLSDNGVPVGPVQFKLFYPTANHSELMMSYGPLVADNKSLYMHTGGTFGISTIDHAWAQWMIDDGEESIEVDDPSMTPSRQRLAQSVTSFELLGVVE